MRNIIHKMFGRVTWGIHYTGGLFIYLLNYLDGNLPFIYAAAECRYGEDVSYQSSRRDIA